MVAIWAVLCPQPISKFDLLNYYIFLLDGIWGGTREVQEFNKSSQQHALANKPPAGHLKMADRDEHQMALESSEFYSGHKAQNQHITWAAGTMNCFFKAWFISTSCNFFKIMFYPYFYSTGFFGSSNVEDYLKHAIPIKVFCIKPNCLSVPLKIWSSPSVTKSFWKSVFTHSRCLQSRIPEGSLRLKV